MLVKLRVDGEQQELLRLELIRCVTGRLGGGIRELQVDISGERVILQGRTNTYYAKQLAQEAARTVHEFAQLVNEIVVD